MGKQFQRVLVTGGAGYVGSNLVPKLLKAGYEVSVLDLYIYGDVFAGIERQCEAATDQGDLRNPADVSRALAGCDAVIHLACISNDPSFDLNPELGKSINFDCFRPLVRASKDAGVRRFIYASSSSVYGIKDEIDVTEDLPLAPLTDYSKYKAMCEEVLEEEREPGFVAVTVRPATVCGYAPRLRLDLTVNILTNHAINNGRITVFGGDQLRPNIHIEDMTDLYLMLLEQPDEAIDGKIWNAGYHNLKVRAIADMVRDEVGRDVDIVVTPTDDHRSYHVSSEKIRRDIGFAAARTREGRDRGSENRVPGRQGAELDERQSILQHQADAGAEAADERGRHGPAGKCCPAGRARQSLRSVRAISHGVRIAHRDRFRQHHHHLRRSVLRGGEAWRVDRREFRRPQAGGARCHPFAARRRAGLAAPPGTGFTARALASAGIIPGVECVSAPLPDGRMHGRDREPQNRVRPSRSRPREFANAPRSTGWRRNGLFDVHGVPRANI